MQQHRTDVSEESLDCTQLLQASSSSSSSRAVSHSPAPNCNASFISRVTKERPSTWPTRGAGASYLHVAASDALFVTTGNDWDVEEMMSDVQSESAVLRPTLTQP